VSIAQRGADGPLPGDLYLDPDVPDFERVYMVRDGWSAQVSHVFTGTGWSRLVPGQVRLVPGVHPLPVRRKAKQPSLAV